MGRKFYLGIILAMALALLPIEPSHADNDALQGAILAPQQIFPDDEELVADLRAFYAARNDRPAWNFSGPENAKAFEAFLDSLEKLIDYHGLDASDYRIDSMRKLAAAADTDSKGQLELIVTASLLTLAHDLHGDDLDLARFYDGWNFRRDDADIPTLLAAAVTANQLDTFIESLTPKNPAYAQLGKALKTYRQLAAKGGWLKVDGGPTLKPGDHSARVGQMRARMMAENYLPQINLPDAQNNLYDNDLLAAVKQYQLQNGLEADGNVGSKSIEAMDISITERIDQIIANMERWRHMPDNFPPDRYVMVNIPSITVDVVEDKKSVYRGPVIVGRIDRRTPFINSVVRSMIINPIWHVPIKIARKDILPKLQRDPHYLEKLGFTIRDRKIDPYGETIDWKSMPEDSFHFALRQAPGDKNSLGRLKFDFDNDFAVYMHGTPHQELFKKNERNLSSGCVRLRDPLAVAELLLADNPGPDHQKWTTENIETAINSGDTHWIGLKNPIPVFFVYWTVFEDEAGKINFRTDPYGYDTLLIDKMRGISQPTAQIPAQPAH